MATNRGATSLKRKRRCEDPMREFDNLPAALRVWAAAADLPWRAGSIRRAFVKAMARTEDENLALKELDLIQGRLIAKDALQVWGRDHPQAARDGE